jgi:copper transport protein
LKNLIRIALFIVAASLVTVPAQAHTHLLSSTPGKGDTVRTPVNEILLHFSEAVDARYTVVVLLDASGQQIKMAQLVGASPSKDYKLVLERPLMAGAYTVKWKAAGDDGHVSTGLFDFSVDVPGAINNVTTTEQQPSAGAPAAAAHDMGDMHDMHDMQHADATDVPAMYRPESSWLWIWTRWLNFLALMLMVGAVAFRIGVVHRARRIFDEGLCLDLDNAARRVAVFAAVLALISNALRLWLQSGSLNGPDRMWQSSLLSTMVFHTGWGKAWLVQTIASLGFLIAALIKSRDRVESWYSATAFACIAAATPAFSGHAAAVQQMAIVPVFDDAIHVIAASAWLGSLALLLFAGLPAVLRTENGFSKAGTLVNTFSPLALTMAGIAVFTGALNAFVHINAFSEFWTTPYGRILAIKIGIVIITASMGAYNWKVVSPRLGTSEATAHIKRSATAEVIVAAVIIFLTAILVATPTT